MSKVNEYFLDFLENGGYELGWSEYAPPPIEAISHIQAYGLSPWDYHGITEEEWMEKEDQSVCMESKAEGEWIAHGQAGEKK